MGSEKKPLRLQDLARLVNKLAEDVLDPLGTVTVVKDSQIHTFHGWRESKYRRRLKSLERNGYDVSFVANMPSTIADYRE